MCKTIRFISPVSDWPKHCDHDFAADLKAVQELGGNGTPTFVLNGKRIERVDNSVEALSKLIDDALNEAGSGDTQN